MKLNRRQLIATSVGVVILGELGTAIAEEGALRIILPVSAGSGIDATLRPAQNALAKELKQPVVIENLPGAGGITGTQQLVRAAPDGRTIAFVSNNHAVNPSIYKKMPFDSLNDITPITVVGENPFILVVNPTKLPTKDAKELAAALRAKPGNYNFASPGNGTILHLAAEMFLASAGVQAKHIPYKGTGPMLTDLMGGQVDFGVTSVVSVQGQLKAGTLRAVGVLSNTRVASLPDVSSMQEQGFPDVVVSGWFAFVGPKGLPAAEVKRLHEAIVAAFNAPEVKEAMAKQENQIAPSTPQQAAAFFQTEQARYAAIVKKADVKLD